MNRLLLFLAIQLVVLSCSNTISIVNSKDNQWNNQKREQHLNNRNDATSWDRTMLEENRLLIDDGDYGPFEIGVFPEPKYSLIGKGSFKGGGYETGKFQIKDKKILMSSFFVKHNVLNQDRLKDMKDEVFFQVLILTDTLNNDQLTGNIITSRNHPDYLGQGFVKTINNRIDYAAFITAENNAYAIINTRVFDLRFGKTILIAPQKDKTLRSLQIESPKMSSDMIINYMESLLKDEKALKFFENKDNI